MSTRARPTARPVIEGPAAFFSPQIHPKPLPPLRNGDSLSRAEFERRYDAMPDLKKAELIEGIVFIPSPDFYLPEVNPTQMASPVSFGRHTVPHFDAINWLGHYRAFTPGITGGDNGSIRLDLDNMPRPDAFLIVNPENGGQVRISEDDYVEGGPDLVVEIAYNGVSADLYAKKNVYRRSGVREYSVRRAEDAAIDWSRLREGRCERLAPTDEGELRSEAFPGLWLDPEALIRGDLAAVFEVVRRGVESPEHAAFVDRLRAREPGEGGPS